MWIHDIAGKENVPRDKGMHSDDLYRFFSGFQRIMQTFQPVMPVHSTIDNEFQIVLLNPSYLHFLQPLFGVGILHAAVILADR